MTPPGAPLPASAALEVFASWVSDRESGRSTDFKDLLRSHPDLALELEALHSTWTGLAVSISLASVGEAGSMTSAAKMSRLAARGATFARYRIEGEVARGGMGAILKVWDDDLRRRLAMKVVLDVGDAGSTSSMATSSMATSSMATSPKLVARFLEEAQVTGQLDHPGIVPVHELGLDSNGRLYFTMKLVEGRDLRHIFELVFAHKEGWNVTRALGVLQKACEAVAYAHKKGVIHRDLKPANVMVGSFGEVFVMDWGLARVLGRKDAHDIRIEREDGSDEGGDRDRVRTERSDLIESSPGSPLLTVAGDVLGTAAYMPPEQARGDIEGLTPRSDVYSVGAMLYHLLARHAPYMEPGKFLGHHAVLLRVLGGPPKPLRSIDPKIAPELAAICEKAMAREPAERYATTLELAEDLRAYLENRVVAAYETGALAELRKWVVRNKTLAAASVALVLTLAVGLVVSSSLFVKAKREKERADTKAAEAQQRTEDVLALSAIQDLQELVDRADAAWPATPDRIQLYEAWLADARALIDGRPEDLARGIKSKPGLSQHRDELALIEKRGRSKPAEAGVVAWDFDSTEDRWWHAQLERLIANLAAFSDPATGILSAGTNEEHGWGVEKRLAFARTIAESSLASPEAKRRWSEAIASIADPAQCPLYGGLRISPQLGLLPVGRDPATGLWEFAELQSGEPAQRGADGKLAIGDSTGLVFVLLPGGTVRMGAQPTDETQPNFDPNAGDNEAPVNEVTLSPYFISKYEMTQGQWLRFSGTNPSGEAAGKKREGRVITLAHPVEQVNWQRCTTVLSRLGLVLSTEAQWEFAARAGTSTPWWTGREKESLEGAANLADGFLKSNGGPNSWNYEEWLDDGYASTSPVGAFRANAFGIHDTAGNVWEWCRDAYTGYGTPARPGDGERSAPNPRNHPVRGGSATDPALNVRASVRDRFDSTTLDPALGCRPVRSLAL